MADVSPAVAALLAAQRDALNERFAARRRGGARIDPAAFLAHVREAVAPAVDRVHARFPERAAAALAALYDAALDLFAASLLGPEAKLPAVHRVWTDLLPHAVPLLAREPASVIGCLCNAAVHVAGQRGTRPELWLGRMRSALPHCQSLAALVDAGVVAAWQAGMPQFRGPALAAAERAPSKPAAVALGLLEDASAETVRELVTAMKGDRWHRPGAPAGAAAALVPVGEVGGFTGFGGPFPRPPQVSCLGGQFVAAVGEARWRVIADAFGAWFQRVAPTAAKAAPLPKDVAVDAQGVVRWGSQRRPTAHLAGASSVACDGETLAVTIPTSHLVFLFARTRRGA